MNPHDIDEIDARGELDTTSSGPHAGELGESQESAGKKAKKAAPRKHRKARPKQNTLQEEAEAEAATGGSHPRPDRATIERLLRNEFAVSPEVAAAALNVSRNSGYTAIHNKDIPATRVGNRIMVPTAYLRRRLCMEPLRPGEELPVLESPFPETEPATPASSPQSAAHPKKQEMKQSPNPQQRRRR